MDVVRSYLDGVRELLDDDDSITDNELRRHLKQVFARVEWCINNSTQRSVSLEEAIERMLSAMARATAASSKKDCWRDKLNT